MVIKPKVRGFICTTAHPLGCEAGVRAEIEMARKLGAVKNLPKRVLVVGSSMGYGLSSRIVAAFGARASTLGVCYERAPGPNRTASAGWYNTVYFHKFAQAEGVYARTVSGDAFSSKTKAHVIKAIREDLGKVDLVLYSVASPRRTDPVTGVVYNSVLKPIGAPYTGKTVNPTTGEVSEVTVSPASEAEVAATTKVMGGEDWFLWMKALKEADVLEENALTLAYSYLGPALTKPIYRYGTIGKAKEHLEAMASSITKSLSDLNGQALISINKALVTQSSSAIPVLPLYIALLFSIMKSKGVHETCLEQMHRLFREKVFLGGSRNKHEVDGETGFVRLDEFEMEKGTQDEVSAIWDELTTNNVADLTDLDGYNRDFFNLFGFDMKGIDYDAEVEHNVKPTMFEVLA